MKLETMILTTDFSACARQAYGPAADLARRTGAGIDLVHCTDSAAQYSMAGFPLDPRIPEAVLRAQESRLQAELASEVFRGLRVEGHLLKGLPPETIVDFARSRGADLLVQSSHGRAGWKRLVLGSFAERALRVSPIPVLTVKGRTERSGEDGTGFQPKSILFPHDFSKESRKALEPVRFFTGIYGARVLVLHVRTTLNDLFHVYGITDEAVSLEVTAAEDKHREQMKRDLKEFAARELEGLAHEEEVIAGDPAAVILEKAAGGQVDLICMGTHGLTGFGRLLLGSVAEKVLRGAACPVVTLTAGESPVA